MRCDDMKGLFVEALYGELTDATAAEFNAHLETCAACREEFEGMKRTLDAMGRRTRVEPTDAEWAEWDARLDARLDERAEARPGARPVGKARHPNVIGRLPSLRPAWGYGIAAAVLLAFGVYMGRTFFNGAADTDAGPGVARTTETSPPAGAAGDGTSGGGRTADETGREALAYLERSRNLLLGLTNLDEKQAASINFEHSRRVSRELYDRGNVLAVALTKPSQQQLRQLVQGLQIILLQLSNMDAGNGSPVVELVRKGVDSKSILLKINLEAIRAALNEDVFRPADAGGRNRL